MLTSLQAYLSLSPPAPKVLENIFVTRGLHWGIRFATSKSMATGEMEWMVKGRAFRSKWEGHSARCYTNMPLVFHMAISFESFCTKWLPEGKYSVSVTKTSG
ncbi:hypothetical protein AAC387_Pa08g2039 [Persea americana]